MIFRERLRITLEGQIMDRYDHLGRPRDKKRSRLNRKKELLRLGAKKFPSETRLHPRYRKWASFNPIVGEYLWRKLRIEFVLMIQQKLLLRRILAETIEELLQIHARPINTRMIQITRLYGYPHNMVIYLLSNTRFVRTPARRVTYLPFMVRCLC